LRVSHGDTRAGDECDRTSYMDLHEGQRLRASNAPGCSQRPPRSVRRRVSPTFQLRSASVSRAIAR
jgi:hypothetical protein